MEFDILTTCAFGLESVLKRELKILGFDPKVIKDGKIVYKGNERDIALSNMWLRTANRVLIKLKTFKAATFDDMFEGVKSCNWFDILSEDAFIAVRINIKNSQLTSEPACQSIIKKAIIESMKKKYNLTIFPESGFKYDIFCYLDNDELTIALDTSGDGLFKRGYRRSSVEAPIKENLAAGILSLSRWNPEIPLLDPFCGSGTFCIEAGMIANNIAPGLRRKFAYNSFHFIGKEIYEDVYQEAKDLIYNSKVKIIGSDIDEDAVNSSRINAEYANLDIEFQNIDAKRGVRFSDGFVVSNLPYGKRIGGDEKDIIALYRKIGRIFFLRYKNVSINLLTQYEAIEKIFLKKADSKRKLYNGKLKCRLFSFKGFKSPNKPTKTQ